jgi:hypothetical protein
MWIFLSIVLVIAVFAIPNRWFGLLGAKINGVPKELISDALGETNSCEVSFDDEKVTHLRKADGYVESVRWNALKEIYVRLTDTGPCEDDAYLMLIDRDDKGCSILISTQGLGDLLDHAKSLYWYSNTQFELAIEAIKARQLGVRKFLLWSAQRDRIDIAHGFSSAISVDTLSCDDIKIVCQRPSAPLLEIAWKDLSKLQIILDAQGYHFSLISAKHTFNTSVLTEGLLEVVEKIQDLPGFNAVENNEANLAIRACSLVRREFTLYASV